MEKLTLNKINNYASWDLRLILTANGRDYVTKQNKKEILKYIYDNQDNITFYFDYDIWGLEESLYDTEFYKYKLQKYKCKQLQKLNREFLKEYYNNYFNMKIIYMTIISQE